MSRCFPDGTPMDVVEERDYVEDEILSEALENKWVKPAITITKERFEHEKSIALRMWKDIKQMLETEFVEGFTPGWMQVDAVKDTVSQRTGVNWLYNCFLCQFFCEEDSNDHMCSPDCPLYMTGVQCELHLGCMMPNGLYNIVCDMGASHEDRLEACDKIYKVIEELDYEKVKDRYYE